MDWRRRHAGLDEFDPAAIDDRVIGGSGHRHRPAEMIGDAQAHARDCESVGGAHAR
jgi:hypothetical protein